MTARQLARAVFFGVLVFSSAFACRARSDWTHYRGPNGSGFNPNGVFPPFGRRWRLLLQKRDKPAQHFNPPIVSGDTIFFGAQDHNFYSFDLDSGYQHWSFKTGGPVNSVPAVTKDRVYFGSNDHKVYALERETGKKIWEFQADKPVQSVVLSHGSDIIFTSDRGSMYFISPEGKLKHSVRNPYWEAHTFQIQGGIMYWAPRGIHFAPYDVKNRRYLGWRERVIGSNIWYSFPAVDKDRIYFASSRYARGQGGGRPRLVFKARNRLTGKRLWERRALFRPSGRTSISKHMVFMRHIHLLDYMAPALWKKLVIYSAGDTVIRAFQKESGNLAWKKTLKFPTSSAVAVAGNRVYVGVRGAEDETGSAQDGQKARLLCLAADTGKTLWEMPVEGVILSAPVISGKRIMFGTSTYLFYVLEEVF